MKANITSTTQKAAIWGRGDHHVVFSSKSIKGYICIHYHKEGLMLKQMIIIFLLMNMAIKVVAQQFSTVQVDTSIFQPVPGVERPRQQIPKLSSALNQMVQLYSKNQDFRAFAQERDITLEQDKVVATIFPESDFTTENIDQNLLQSYGVEVKAIARHSMRVAIPITQLENTARLVDHINWIEEPLKPKPLATTDEGVALMNADDWQTATYTGSGIKVAVIDLGFSSYSDAVTYGDLPGSGVTTYDYTGTGFETGTEHGTAVAEAVYDVAPGASLYLYKIGDQTDLENAKDACITNGVDVVNHSVGWYNASYYDGTGDICAIANDAISNGIVWVNSAGNEAKMHYRSVFDDVGNGSHDFSGSGQNVNYFGPGDGSAYKIPAGYTIDVFLNWNAYPSTTEDYDLALYYWTGSGWNYITGSFNDQAGGGLPPTERINYTTTLADTVYGVVVWEYLTSKDHDLTLFNWIASFDEQTASSSLLDPATATDVVTVGAIDRNNYASGPQEDFSSQGPTTDGRTKPDVASPDNCNSYTYGYWIGTSLSSPHVAGCVALVHSRFPSLSDSEVKTYLYDECTVDLGIAGKDNIYGWGKVELPTQFDVATPTFSPGGGSYSTPQDVTISTTTPEATTYYTTDGSDPDDTDTEVIGTVTVNENTTLKARSYAEGYNASSIGTAIYDLGFWTETHNITGTGNYTFNSDGDGHEVDIYFTSLSGSGDVVIQQNTTPPPNAPCINVCDFNWDISQSGITSFLANMTFHYTDSDVSGYIESEAFLGIAKFNASTNTWVWLGGTVNAGTNTVTVSDVSSLSTFALFRRIFGDITNDGYVDAADLQHLGDSWHDTNTGEFSEGTDARFFNFNKNTDGGDQIIDAADLQVFGDCWHNGIMP